MSIGQKLLPTILLIGQLTWAEAESRQNTTTDH